MVNAVAELEEGNGGRKEGREGREKKMDERITLTMKLIQSWWW